MSKAKKHVGPEFPVVVETFRDYGAYEIGKLNERCFSEPACFNGMVRYRKYRVTVELIDEPVEVIHERLKKLWRESDNMHEWQPLKYAAAKHGLELDHNELGKDRKAEFRKGEAGE